MSENNLHCDAIEIRRQIIDAYKNEYGSESEETLEKMGELADEWYNFTKFDKALEIRQEILEIVKGDTPAEIQAEKEIAYIYHHSKNYEKEIEHYEKVLELIRAEYGENLIEPLSEMAETFWYANNSDEWGKKRDEIVAIYQQKLDAETSDAAEIIGSLIYWLERIEANKDAAKWQEILNEQRQLPENDFEFEEIDEDEGAEGLTNKFEKLQAQLKKILTLKFLMNFWKRRVKF